MLSMWLGVAPLAGCNEGRGYSGRGGYERRGYQGRGYQGAARG